MSKLPARKVGENLLKFGEGASVRAYVREVLHEEFFVSSSVQSSATRVRPALTHGHEVAPAQEIPGTTTTADTLDNSKLDESRNTIAELFRRGVTSLERIQQEEIASVER